MNALVSGLITAADPGLVITSQARGATAAQQNPAATPSSTVPATTASDEATAAAPPRRRAGTLSLPWAGSGKGIGTDIVGSSVRDTHRRWCAGRSWRVTALWPPGVAPQGPGWP